jgi:uncharacterized membrane protein YgcG
MLYAYLTSRAARPVVAFLLAGSMMGFVLGQQLGHRPAQAVSHRYTPAVVRPLSSGALGTDTLDQPVRAAPAAVHTAPAQPHQHEKKHNGSGDGHHSGDGGQGGGDQSGGGGGDTASSD